MIRPALTLATGIIIGSAGIAGANDALNFWNTNGSAKVAAPLEIRTAKLREDQARIKVANAAAARRLGVPLAFMDRLTMRESGFRFVRGPQTAWGHAHGPHQILCSTAASLGEADCNRLMYDAERSADLSARYIRMGYDATGSWHGAAAHYHGGPNTRMWGHKTRAYAAAVGGSDKPFPRTRNASVPPSGSIGPGIVPAYTFSAMSYGVMR